MTVFHPVAVPTATAAAWGLSAVGAFVLASTRTVDRRIVAFALATTGAGLVAGFDTVICQIAPWILECWCPFCP